MTSTHSRPSSSLRALEWLNFFIADVQTGLGPFLAAYLSANGWNPARVGYALTFQGLVTVGFQTPAGAIVDAARCKRLLVIVGLGFLVAGALLLCLRSNASTVYTSGFLIGVAGPLLGPTLAAITLGLVSGDKFDTQFARNQSFNSAGNVATALLIGLIGYGLGYRAVFLTTAFFAIPSIISLLRIDTAKIDYARARGSTADHKEVSPEGFWQLTRDRVLLFFLASVFLFHLSNAAMLPQLGGLLAHGKARAAAPFMSACIIVTQLVIAAAAAWVGKRAHQGGRRPLLLLGFGVLPIRGLLYTLTKIPALLVAIQVLDGVANCIFVVVSILVIADLTRGTGRFNLASGAMATVKGIGAALSNALGGFLIQKLGFNASFAGLALIGALAFSLLFWKVPETKNHVGRQAEGQNAPVFGLKGSPIEEQQSD
jgi:MFS family permease